MDFRRRRRLEPRGDARHGTDPRTRMKLLAERVKAMKAIWTVGSSSNQAGIYGFSASSFA